MAIYIKLANMVQATYVKNVVVILIHLYSAVATENTVDKYFFLKILLGFDTYVDCNISVFLYNFWCFFLVIWEVKQFITVAFFFSHLT